MNGSTIARLICIVNALMFLSSCGSTNPGPGVAVFTTVTVTPSVLTPQPPSKVFTGAVCTSGTLTGGTIVEDAPLSVTLKSDLYAGVTTGKTVNITGYSVNFKPSPGAPAIDGIPWTGYSASIPAGGSVVVTIPITNDNTKAKLQNDPVLSLCAAHNYDYSVTITFSGTETGGTNAPVNAFTSLTYTNIP